MEVKGKRPGRPTPTAPHPAFSTSGGDVENAEGPAVWALADEWLDERQTIGRGISTATEAAYRRGLTAWAWRIAELSPDVDGHHPQPLGYQEELGRLRLIDLTADNVKRALASLAREDYAPASRSRMLAALRGF